MRMFASLCVILVSSLPVVAAGAGSASLLSGYVPGQPNLFVFRLPPVSNLGSYNIELLLSSPTGVPGNDFFFAAAETAPASSNYVFPSAENFFASTNVLTGNTHSLTLSDFSTSGVNVVAETNDAVASVVFRTSASFSGVLSLSLGEDSFQLDTPAVTPTAVSEYAAARTSVAADVNVSVAPVPEPSAVVLIAIGLAPVVFRRRSIE